jgi:hypothetical protein
MAAPVSFRERVRFFSLAPQAPSIHDTQDHVAALRNIDVTPHVKSRSTVLTDVVHPVLITGAPVPP